MITMESILTLLWVINNKLENIKTQKDVLSSVFSRKLKKNINIIKQDTENLISCLHVISAAL